MDVREIIRQWHEIADNGRIEDANIFFRFIAVWVAFNALYNLHHNGGDRFKVEAFASRHDTNEIHQGLMESDEEYHQAVLALKDKGVIDTRNGRHRTISHEGNLSEVMTCIYQVRNNLFHGSKTPQNSRDEGLVTASYIVISKLMRPFI